MPVASKDVRAVQAFYPRIYLACHLRHVRRPSSGSRLTEAESHLLGHLDERWPVRASTLARHMGVSRSSMSAAIKRLTRLGYISRTTESADRRAAGLRLSTAGVHAMQAGSVLDTTRVEAMLARLAPDERRRAVDGLALLGRAANELPTKHKGDTR